MKYVNIIKLSDFVISYFDEMGGFITPMKLQKLLYYIQAWHLANFNHSLFVDEPEAWVNGPVYKHVYDKYKHITRHDYIFTKDRPSMSEALTKLDLSEKQQSLVFEVLQVYGKYDEFKLVNKTHSEDPWIEARKGLKPFESSRNDISHFSIKKYYKKKLQDRT